MTATLQPWRRQTRQQPSPADGSGGQSATAARLPHPRAHPRPVRAGVVLVSDILRKGLNADCSVLMGANVANDMASDQFCETTIGYKDPKNGALFKLAFDAPALKVGIVQDTVGVELCGALKNIVAIGAHPGGRRATLQPRDVAPSPANCRAVRCSRLRVSRRGPCALA